MEEKLKQLFGESWYNILKDYLNSDQFLNLGKIINSLREKSIIYPSSDKVFRIFKEVPFDKINVVVLSMDPYNDGAATGVAFDNSESIRLSPSLKYIFQEIEQEYPELTDRFEWPFGGMDKGDLSYMTKQGVFLYNVSLTVIKGKAGSHSELWRSFTIKIVENLNRFKWLPWLLLGKKAQEFIPLINKNHSLILSDHPAFHAYSPDAKFIGSGVFRKINFELNSHGRKEILW
jgi:uracil-DNA glycosylase